MSSKMHEVVISGISGRFPDCSSVEEFKEKLFSKSNLLHVDFKRYNSCNDGRPTSSGKIPDSDKFDGNFFGMPSGLVRNCEPIKCLMLEATFEAIVDAGLNPYTMTGRNISVITATGTSDSEALRVTQGLYLEGTGMVGSSRAMFANRISYTFNFTGPSCNFDNTWNSALQALEKAAGLVREGAVEAAVVASANLLFHNGGDLNYRQMNLLAPDVTCSPFDADAQGFARSESAVAYFIQRAQDAKRIYGTILSARSTYVSHISGRFLQPNLQMESFFKQCCSDCNLDPVDVSYIETGVFCDKDFDSEELNALGKVYCHPKKSKVLIGSVMGNVGNSEAPSGLVSLTKAILALEAGVIPPTINYCNPNPRVPLLVSGHLQPVTELTELPGDFIAVNNLTFNGNVAHVLVKRNAKDKSSLGEEKMTVDDLPRLVVLQARHEEGARAITEKLYSMAIDPEYISLVNDVFKIPVPAYLWGSFAILPAAKSQPISNIQKFNRSKRPLWYIFSGMGSQWVGMGRDLLRVPVFAAAIDRCAQVLRPRGLDIKHIITTDDRTVFDNILNCFVGIAAVQIGLVDIMTTLGVKPDGMMGHSVGEIGCAYADGCFTSDEMILAAYARGRASLECKTTPGMMAAVGKGYQEMKGELPPSIDVACHNSATSCTLSGPTEDVMDFVKKLKKEGVFAKAVSAGGIAYHSRYIQAVGPKLLQYLRETIPNPKPRTSRWVSSSVPQPQWNTEDAGMSSAEYHTNNLLSPVLFEEACKFIPKDAILVELAPRGLLQGILRSANEGLLCLSMTSSTAEDNVCHLLSSVGTLYLNNVAVDINSLYPRVPYPVSRGTPSLTSLVTWNHSETVFQELYSQIDMAFIRSGGKERTVEINTEVPELQLLKDHCLYDKTIVPLSLLLIYALEHVFSLKRKDIDETSAVFGNVTNVNNLFTEDYGTSISVKCSTEGRDFEVSLNSDDSDLHNKTILVGMLHETTPASFSLSQCKVDKADMETVLQDEVYCFLSHLGYQLGPRFHLINEILISNSECVAKVEWTGSVMTFLSSLFNVVVFLQMNDQQRLLLPSHFDKLTVHTPLLKQLETGTLVDVHYDRRCNRLVCQYAELLGLAVCPPPKSHLPNLLWSQIEFQPFFSHKRSLEDLLSVFLQLSSRKGMVTLNNNPSSVQILQIIDESGTSTNMTDVVKNILETEAFVKSDLIMKSDKAEMILSSPGHQSYLVVGEYSSLEALASSLAVQDHTLYLSYLDETETKPRETMLKPIFTHQTQNGTLAVMKKVNLYRRVTVFEVLDNNWLSDLRRQMSKEEGEGTVYVVSHNVEPREVLKTLDTEPYIHQIRFVFILDQDAPRFSLTTPVYSSQLSLGLPVNILSGGVWGCLVSRSSNITPQKQKLDLLFKRGKDGLDVTCIGLNPTNFTLTPGGLLEELELKYMDYSGWSSGEPVMGIAQLDSDSTSLVVDRILRWAVPVDWTMEDAATVPVTYTLAYYCIHLKARLKANDNILVHAGMSILGQAVIRLALSVGGNVFASVTKEEEVLKLLKLFPSLNPKHVVVLYNKDISVPLRTLTAGVGMHVIINCLQGRELQSSIKTMGAHCRFLHLANIKVQDRESVGMSVFIKNTSFHGISLKSLVKCSEARKNELLEKVKKGIEEGIVKPFEKSSFHINQQTEAFNNLKIKNGDQKTVLMAKERNLSTVRYDPDHLVLIAGTNTQFWLDVAEWLVTRGARRLIVLSEEERLVGSHGVRFNNLVSRPGTTIYIASIAQTDSIEDALILLKNFLRCGMISSIFCLQMNEGSSRVRNLDYASRQLIPELRQFVCLLTEGAGVCESRAATGLSAYSVQSNHPLHRPALVLPYLSHILANNSSTTHAKFFIVTDHAKVSEECDVPEGRSLLFSSLEELSLLGLIVSEVPCFSEVVTRSPSYGKCCRPLLPVFVVPRLGSNSLQPLLRQLIHPTFCSSPPEHIHSIKQYADYLLESILKQQPRGPYNIVGDFWNGAVALELSCSLQERGHQVDLFLLEGAPSIAQDRVKSLCKEYNADLATSLVAAALGLSLKDVKDVSQLKEWDTKLEAGLACVPVSMRAAVSRALTSLYHQLSALLQFQHPNQLFQGNVTLITAKKCSPSVLAKLGQCCQHSPNLIVTGDQDHNQLISNCSVVTAINENTAFDCKS